MSTIQDVLDILNDIEDKSMPFVIETELGLLAMCPANSVVEPASDGSEVFVMCPCLCHAAEDEDEIEIVFDVKAEDSEINLN
jgi:hypothetical protein